ncbi:MAG: restriction endonuclease subunit S [Gemmataceae bacterium]|nr:restriction endonuclease subunit S [Gemmataceae bacterium]
MSAGLPDGWAMTRLGEITAPSSEKIEPTERPDALYLSLEHIEGETGRIVGRGKGNDVNSTKAVFRAGDVLYGKLRPYLNKVCIPDFDGICSTDILVFARCSWLENRWLKWFLSQRHVVEYANHHSTGVQLPRIRFGMLVELEFPLPPLAEQKRIVAKVEALLARVNAARERLAKVPAILKRFRQAVLDAACSGQLTADWRDETSTGDGGQQLLKRLLKERRERWSSCAGKRYKEPAEPDTAGIEQVPDEWTVASIDQLTTLITSRSRDWSKYYGTGSGTFIMAQNVRPGVLDLTFRQAVNPPTGDRDRTRSQVQYGDLLVTIVGANTGDVCWVDRSLPEHYVCQSVALMRTTDPQCAPYLNCYLNSVKHGRGQYDRYIYGEGRPHLGFDHLRMTAIILPPLAEQKEIVRRVEALFKLADAIEKRVAAATQRADKLTQAILAKAFRGELVPTEAELARAEGRAYEPASVLLERIRAERNQGNGPATARRTKPRRSEKRPGA